MFLLLHHGVLCYLGFLVLEHLAGPTGAGRKLQSERASGADGLSPASGSPAGTDAGGRALRGIRQTDHRRASVRVGASHSGLAPVPTRTVPGKPGRRGTRVLMMARRTRGRLLPAWRGAVFGGRVG